jgi:hypothetical protein
VAKDRRNAEEYSAETHQSVYTEQAGHRPGSETAEDAAEGHPSSQRREDLFGPTGRHEAPHCQPEGQHPQGQDLPGDQHQCAEYHRRLTVREENKREWCHGEHGQHSG